MVNWQGKSQLRPGLAFPIYGLLCAALSGCQLAYFFNSQRQEQVAAESRDLVGKRVAVVVWAQQATLDLDPFVRHRVGRAVRYYLMKGLPEAHFVDTRDVDEMQEKNGSLWQSWSHEEIGERLHCDRIVWIDLMLYTTRLQDARALRKGRIEATASVFDGSGHDTADQALYNTDVSATYPPGATASTIDMSDADILHNTVELFAQAIAGKFYDHERPYTRKDVR